MAIENGTISFELAAGRFPKSVISGSATFAAPASIAGTVKTLARVASTPSLIACAYSPGRGPKPKRCSNREVSNRCAFIPIM